MQPKNVWPPRQWCKKMFDLFIHQNSSNMPFYLRVVNIPAVLLLPNTSRLLFLKALLKCELIFHCISFIMKILCDSIIMFEKINHFHYKKEYRNSCFVLDPPSCPDMTSGLCASHSYCYCYCSCVYMTLEYWPCGRFLLVLYVRKDSFHQLC